MNRKKGNESVCLDRVFVESGPLDEALNFILCEQKVEVKCKSHEAMQA